MYSKQQATRLKQEFWTAFGQHMNPVLSADGEKLNWVNYKTGEKNIAFRMEADNRKASISIELSHKDADIQQLYFEQFRQLQHIFYQSLQGHWTWRLHTTDEEGKLITSISTELEGVSIFKKEDWPSLISFFKTRIMGLDAFWSQAKYAFESLR